MLACWAKCISSVPGKKCGWHHGSFCVTWNKVSEYIPPSLLLREGVCQTAPVLYHPASCRALAFQKEFHQPRGFNSGQDKQKEKLPNTSPRRLRAGIVTRGFWEHIKDHCFPCPLFPHSLASQYQYDPRAWLCFYYEAQWRNIWNISFLWVY